MRIFVFVACCVCRGDLLILWRVRTRRKVPRSRTPANVERMTVTERFLDFVKYDTQSDELTNMTPSSPGQMEFAEYLKSVVVGMGLQDVDLDDNGYLMATLPANTDKSVPAIGFIAHMDTSPDMSGKHVTLSLIHISEPTRPY